ncbi:MAG TPA: hypothetical protein VGK81_05745 [Anaerolineae bacterium]
MKKGCLALAVCVVLFSTGCAGAGISPVTATATLTPTPCAQSATTNSDNGTHRSTPQTPAAEMPTLSPEMRQTQEAITLNANPGNPTGSPAPATGPTPQPCQSLTPTVPDATASPQDTPATPSGG